MKVCSIQFNPEGKNKSERIEKATRWIRKASNYNPDLIVLPELWNVSFFNFEEYKKASENLGKSETIKEICSLAKEIGSFIHIGSIVEKEDSNFFNTSILLDKSGRIIATYRKIHLFGYGSEENKILTSGRDLCVAKTEFGDLGLSTCYDLRFPELYRKLVDKGAQMFLVTSAWPSSRPKHWQLFNRVRALENQAFLISSNCVGSTEKGNYLGHSMILDPWGEIVAEAGNQESVIYAEINMEEVKKARDEFPALKDRKYF